MLLVRVATVLVATVLVASCSGPQPTACRCPQPVSYDDATIKQITAALKALPPDSVLQRAMDDYEDERDDLRICLGLRN
jgi:hypothetical protein